MNRNALIALGIIGIGLLGAVGFYFFSLKSSSYQPLKTPPISVTPPAAPTSSAASTSPQSELKERPVRFWLNGQRLSTGKIDIGQNLQGEVPSIFEVSPIESSCSGEYCKDGLPRLDHFVYRWKDLKITNQANSTTLNTSKDSTGFRNGILIGNVWTFGFPNNQYFILKYEDCGTGSCRADYYMYRFDQNGLKLIVGKKSNWMWSAAGQSDTGFLEGVLVLQNKLYLIFSNQRKFYTIIVARDGGLERISAIDASGWRRPDLEKIIPSWNLK